MRRPSVARLATAGSLGAAFLTVGLAAPAAAQTSAAAGSTARPHHSLEVVLAPDTGHLSVVDTLRVPAGGRVEFLLNASLALTRSEPAVEELPAPTAAARGEVAAEAIRFFGINSHGADLYAGGKLKRYRATLPEGGGTLRLEYAGKFDFGLSDQKEEYTRGFRETLGIVSPQGVYLSGSGYWYPQLGPGLLEFDVSVTQPEGWHVISQGNGASRDAEGRARWESHGAMDEIYLVGGPLQVYRDSAGAVEALVYLHEPDPALAAKYLAATAQYLEMYRQLIGPYPYGKFALVENFWETGYGMPSFTLLGPQIIRFPFILTSSYPHEILHNWWGNSVFVDYETGNWCEGLTAYMADHLIQEQRGTGEGYRRDTLQKYRNYVKDERDFPLSEFRGRHSAATEAVGYGKTLMGFHMLRRRLGDDAFRQWAARFYRQYRGQQASFTDVRTSLEVVSGETLERFFHDWVERPGAASLALANTSVTATDGGGFEVRGTLRQTQEGEAYLLDVPVVVQTSGKVAVQTVRMEASEAPFKVQVAAAPLALHVDPAFDLFRKLDPRETPASIGQIFGEPRILAVLPADAPETEREGYRTLIEGWRSDAHQPEIRTDAEVAELPADRAVWLLGRSNRLAAKLLAAGAEWQVKADALVAQGETLPLAGHSLVLTARHPANAEKAIGWIVADPAAALPGLGRKLPHYGKYSYLGFEGDEPTNVLKGQWAATDSPLRVDLRPATDRTAAMPALTLPARQALAELPPVFSELALRAHVAWLAAPEREGRGIGTAGLEAAAEYVAEQFSKIGLEPGGDGGSYFQRFPAERTPDGKPATLRNVIGVLRGTKPEWQGQSVVIGAHYDHLGRGWPDARQESVGQVHPGADDNASGVAVLIELARAFASGEKPARTLVFVAFSGEESGLVGSKFYVAHPLFPLDKTLGAIVLDTVGRLGDGKLSVLATGTASEWPHIFRGIGFVTGVESKLIPGSLESSDQKSFIDAGVPGVQLFTDPHADYHRPGDTADKIDAAGLVRVATVAKEAVAYLAERPEPMTVTIPRETAPAAPAPAAGAATPAPAQGRRVSFGTVPDFAFEGPGVKVSEVVPGSPAEQAGVQAGDVLLRMAGQEITSLRAYSNLLKTLAPGQAVAVVVRRGGEEKSLSATLVAR